MTIIPTSRNEGSSCLQLGGRFNDIWGWDLDPVTERDLREKGIVSCNLSTFQLFNLLTGAGSLHLEHPLLLFIL